MSSCRAARRNRLTFCAGFWRRLTDCHTGTDEGRENRAFDGERFACGQRGATKLFRTGETTTRMNVSRVSILIVADDSTVREALFIGMQKRKYHCQTASSMDNARFMLTARHFDLILCELKLMDGSGLELCQRIRQTRPQTVVLILSEPVAHRYEAEALQSGAAAFLLKPIECSQLDKVIRRVLALTGSE
ncbi:MAG TPA: response regulator [Blastocatellia bacterium]|nr:response regulator [Blastocatellia bacterium]